jgi:hypothetical protein
MAAVGAPALALKVVPQIPSPRCRRGFAAGHQFGDIITPATLSILITLPQRGTPR